MSTLEAVFSWVLTTTWQASVLAVLVLLAQWALGSRLNPRWRYALWLLVVLRLLLPSLPESAFSVFRVAPAAPFNLPGTLGPRDPLPAPQSPSPAHTSLVIAESQPNSTFLILAVLWLGGALGFFLLTWLVNRRFARHVANAPPITDPALLKIFAQARVELTIRRRIRLVESTQVNSPAIMGLFTPTLLLPGDAGAKFTPRELRYIFLHELAHLKRGDVTIQALIALLQIIHWFNPVLWYAFRRLRADREPATDALVLSRTGEADKEPYGLMLIKLLEHFQQRHALPTLVGILEDTDQFKRRFSLIARFTRGAYGWSLLGVLVIALLAAVCLTKAKATSSVTTTHDGEPVRLQLLAIDAPANAFTGPQAADQALRQYEQRRLKMEASNRGYHFSGNDVPRLISEMAQHTHMGQGAGWITGPGFLCLDADCTPQPHGSQISLTGTLTINSQQWSGVDPHRTLTLDAIPNGSYPISLVVDPQQLRSLEPEGILEPAAAQPPKDKSPRRLFVFLSVWPESADKAAAADPPASSAPITGERTSDAPTKAPVAAPHPHDRALDQKLLALICSLPVGKMDAVDSDKLTQLLVQGADPNVNLQPDGCSALFTAAVANQIPVVKILLQHGGDPNHKNSCGNALIDWVLDQGHLEMATVLHDAGANISPVAWAGANGDISALKQFVASEKIAKGKTGEAMKYAVSVGQLDAVKFLEGIDGHPIASHFLVQAAESGNLAMLGYLLKQGAAIKTDGGDAMDEAVIFFDQPEAVKFLIAHGADPNRMTKWQDYLISSAKSAAMVKVLLEAGANPNVESIFGPALALAPDRESVQLMVQHGANLKPKLKNGNTLIEQALCRGLYDKPDVVDELIKEGAQFDPKTDGVGALAHAAWVNQVQTMQVLLDHGVDPNGYCDEPYMHTSVLRDACFNHCPDAVRLLLAHGANPAGDSRDEFSPLSFALYAGQWESADLLQQAGAHDVPALSNAAARGDLAQVTQLLQGGANVNEADRTGNTPLHYAVRPGQLEVARLLLEHGANINLFNAEGITARTSFGLEAGSGNPDQAQMDWGVSQDESKRLIAAFKDLFAQYPSDFSYRNAQGRTLLHQMAATGNTMISLAIDDKAHPIDVNLADHDGNTPLLLAATSPTAGDLSTRVMIPVDPSKPDGKTNDWNAAAYIVNLLLKAGAKVDLKLPDGQTIGAAALAAATKAKNPQLISLLQATR